MASFWKPEACGQTVLPDRSVLVRQKLVENAKIQNSNATFWVIFKQCEDVSQFQSLKFWSFESKSFEEKGVKVNLDPSIRYIPSG